MEAIQRLLELDGQALWDALNQYKISLALGLTVVWTAWSYRPRNLPPGPRGWPFKGAMSQITDMDNMHLDFERMKQKYGDIFSMYMGRKLTIILNSHRAVKEAFIQMDDFSDRPQDVMQLFLDTKDEIFFSRSPYNEKWKAKKKFATQALKKFGFGTAAGEARIQNEVNTLVEFLDKQNGEAVDIREPLGNMAANVMSSIMFNHPMEWDDPHLQNLKDFCITFVELFVNLSFLEYSIQYFPIWLLRIYYKKTIQESLATYNTRIRPIVQQEIDEHKATFDPNNLRDFVDVYLRDRKDDPEFSDEVLVDTTAMFIPDSVETVAAYIYWFFLYMGHYQDIQARIQAEIDEVCQASRPGLADRSKLHVLEATMAEAARHSTVVPIVVPHTSLKNTKLRNFDIPANSSVIANLYSVHMDPEMFENPTQFNPDRFLNDEGVFTKSEGVIPFSAGRRMCMGEMLSKSELYLCAATLLQKFRIVFPDDQPSPSMEKKGSSLGAVPDRFKIRAIPR